MIGVVVPAHNEEELLPACLAALERAAGDPALGNEAVQVIVALDACTDRSAEIAREAGVSVVQTDARCVGSARAAGARLALENGARWLAFTDADSEVPAEWLSRQLAHEADLFCGIVRVAGWHLHEPEVRRRYDAHYVARDGHRHIHGANLGVSAAAYASVGGFAPLVVGEDVALVEALVGRGARVAWMADPSVVTHARRDFRAPNGFGAFLLSLLHGDDEEALPLPAAG